MAETRKFNPDEGSGLQKLVREALGETVRPTAPGETREAAGTAPEEPTVDESDAAKVPDNPLGFGQGGGGTW